MEMKLQTTTIELDVRIRSDLTTQMPAQHDPAEALENLNRAESQKRFNPALRFVRFDLRKRLAMPQAFIVREASDYEWICSDETIVNDFAVDRLQRGCLLRCEYIMLEQRQRRIADEIVHAEPLPQTFCLRPDNGAEKHRPELSVFHDHE